MAFTTTDGHTSGASAMRVEQGRMLYGLREIAAAGAPTKPACGNGWNVAEGHIRCDPLGEGAYSV